MITIEIDLAGRDFLQKILDSHLSELRNEIAATKRDTSPLHAEEDLIKQLKLKLSKPA